MLYPLLTQRKLVEPIWGGTTLTQWLDLPEPRPSKLGETWQVYDTNQVLNGSLAGHTLAELAREYGAALVGTRTVERYGNDFPLLAKFIDAADRLSIQVHPNDEYAHTVEAATGFHGKTEAWYIVQAAPGATVTYGVNRPTSREEFAAAIAAGEVEKLVGVLPVKAGDVVFVPAGTLHAINAGIVLFEIQQKSDLTYRLYDYNRRDAKTGQLRELHVEKSLDVLDYQPSKVRFGTPLPLSPDWVPQLLVACPYFALERWAFEGSRKLKTEPGSFEIWTLLEGAGTIRWAEEALTLRRGDSVVVPADLGDYSWNSSEGKVQLLRAYVPDLDKLSYHLRQEGNRRELIDEIVFRS
jgi:mannose-6-phosphate isomerase